MSNHTVTITVLCVPPRQVYVLLLFSLFTAPLHFLIIRVLVVRFRLSLPRHKILLCLSISDNLQILGSGLIVSIGLAIQPTLTSQSCQVLRQILQVVAAQTHSASSGFILLLAIERYIACIYSLRFYTIVTSSRTSLAVVSVWVISISSGLLSLTKEPSYTQLILDRNLRAFYVYVMTTPVTTLVLIIVQARLYKVSRTKLKIIPHNMFGAQKEKDDLTRKQLKLGFTASIVFIMYIVCMLPMAGLSVYSRLNPEKDVSSIRQVLVFLSALNTFIDPFVYGVGMADVRQGIKGEFRKLKQRIWQKY